MTPRQARAARAFLGLDMKTVCKLANLGKRTLTEFESGGRKISNATEAKIKAFYISQGITFSSPDSGEGIGLGRVNQITAKTDEPLSKVEYTDFLSIGEVTTIIGDIAEAIHQLGKRQNISQVIIKQLSSRTGMNQKELAAQLECTPSFLNAVFVGKKSLPVSYASIVQESFKNDNISIRKALENERIIGKIIAQIGGLQRKCLEAWTTIPL